MGTEAITDVGGGIALRAARTFAVGSPMKDEVSEVGNPRESVGGDEDGIAFVEEGIGEEQE